MASWLLHYSELTPDQQRIVELPLNDNRVVYGPPGSGKTQVLIHRAAYLQEKYRT
ncbi:MAG: UvrD-helicase domain-containing protein, partial [bacterium]|nr:UvrD-helicase domain-containing protein [bacterium]